MKSRLLLAALLTFVFISSTAWSYYLRLASTGEAMTEAAEKFLATLDEQHRAAATFEFDDPRRVDWHFIPLPSADKPEREGLKVRQMNESERKAAFALLKSALSEVGYEKATKIMALESLLAELQKAKGGPIRDSERYYFCVFGKPTADGKWGLSVEGHHLSLNFVVEKGKVISSTPTVFAANPATVMSDYPGSHDIKKGTRVLAKEETLAFDLVQSLTPEERKAAIIAEKAPSEVRAAGEPQPPTEAAVGIAADKLTDAQRKTLVALLDAYCDNLPAEVAKARKAAIDKAGTEKVRFAWAGADKPGVGHYYRVQGPTFLIEFVNTQPDSAGNPANHIHSLWRDMAGDFAVPIAK
ncbi:MAG TPA: DUF3500 domain-containing protein [Pirellulaceae bacterium]|nr:DUF3500 domain-containing protein [Pirellulaceae bacterium]